MKILSFSLYGENPIYTIGAIKNAKLKQHIFPEWEMWIYYNDTVPKKIIEELKKFEKIKLIFMDEDNKFVNSMWRFLPASESNVEYFISRDADSRISERDSTAVQEWINSNKLYHIIRDHPIGHAWPINAGMWGCKGNTICNISEQIKNYIIGKNYYEKSIDQCFLRDVIYPKTLNSLFLHDEYYNYEKIGKAIKRDRKKDKFAFIGESLDENDIPRGDQRSPIISRYK